MQLISVAALAVSAAGLAVAVPQYGGYGVIPQGYGYGVPHHAHHNYNPNPFGRWGRCNNWKLCFSGYAQTAAYEQHLPAINQTAGLALWNTTDTNDWAINSVDQSVLVARNPGLWNILARVAVNSSNVISETQNVTASILVNGLSVYSSEETVSVSPSNPLGLIVLALTRKFCKGDRVQVRLNSTNSTESYVDYVDLSFIKLGGESKQAEYKPRQY